MDGLRIFSLKQSFGMKVYRLFLKENEEFMIC